MSKALTRWVAAATRLAAAGTCHNVADKPGRHLHQLQQGSHRPLHEALLQRLHSRRCRLPRHPHRLRRLRPHPDHPSCHSYLETAKKS
ncbi:unnamed protein product [Closterium sp. NIES-53]